MRILVLSTHNEKCGIAAYNDDLVSALRGCGNQVDIHPVDTERVRTLDPAGIIQHYKAFIDRTRSDDGYDAYIIQHEDSFFSGLHPRSVGLRVFSRLLRHLAGTKKPVAIFFHSDPASRKDIFSKRRFFLTRICKLINSHPSISVFVHGRDSFQKYHTAGIDSASITSITMPFGTVRDTFRPASGDEIVLTIVGFVIEYKGYTYVLDALRRLPSRFKLVVAGSRHPSTPANDQAYSMVEAAATGDLSGRVSLTGWLSEEELSRQVSASDIVLAPYLEDGPSGSAAMTWGITHSRPMIVTKTRSFADIAGTGDCVEMVPPRDARALADAIERLAGDTARQAELVANSSALAEENSWEKLAARLTDKLTTRSAEV